MMRPTTDFARRHRFGNLLAYCVNAGNNRRQSNRLATHMFVYQSALWCLPQAAVFVFIRQSLTFYSWAGLSRSDLVCQPFYYFATASNVVAVIDVMFVSSACLLLLSAACDCNVIDAVGFDLTSSVWRSFVRFYAFAHESFAFARLPGLCVLSSASLFYI